ncbi:hypothetical protein GGH12_001349 [Coemansia sp. RSA 1822]|nr:hypothetical protein LPJ76_005185 [Coemansia sp. RSA 638]KAJ2123648.1 hypothetical protein IW147_002397 [Coemansia sp. RSA 720]KAJ2475631.1 hypothetical protein IWW56_005329 [Coemansia sp. RSA 2131]KAJ2539625.1 hypothetical protein GGF49_005086 [Coemansia sp. RSA 1853]KAJ2565554.1 hypothetical protein GGH12_001349 [Coemansia sp. RSA 1822]KAJ2659177.1 hypothetical protein IW148_004372 [Coemansia sp. RSA 1199]
MPFTFHSHSGQFCRHAKGTLENVVKAAIAKNMLALGLTEHVPRSRTQDLYPEESDLTTNDLYTAFHAYVDEARRLRKQYGSQIHILIGAETEYITHDTLDELKHLRKKYDLDFLVGSLHHVNGMPMDFSPELYEQIVEHCSGSRSEMFRRYFDEQLVLLQELQPEIVGHFDLIRIFHPYSTGVEDPLLQADIRKLALRNIDYAISYGAIFEINTRAWKKGLRDAYPQRDLLQEIMARGGRITLSDDSHGEHDVCMHYDRALAYLREMGVRQLHYLCKTAEGAVQVCVLDNATEHEFWAANGFS